jgi:hypothetical protein
VALLVALSIADQARAVYVETVPTTWEAARRLIDQRLGRPIGRQIAFEPGERRLSLGAPRRRPLVHVVAELTAAAPRVLDGADAIAFPTHRLASGAGSSYRQRWEATPPDGRHRIDSGAFAARGESVTVLLHPWEPVATGTWTTLAPDGVLRLPPAVRGELLSLEVERRRRRSPAAALRLELGPRGGAVRLEPVGERLQREWLQSPRLPAPEGGAAARLVGPPEHRRGLRWRVVRWRRAS